MKYLKIIALLGAACLLAAQTAHAAKNYTDTRYPIVLVHGLLGFDEILGIDYFYRIPDRLEDGGADVFVAQVSANNSTELRGEQLLDDVKRILAVSGASKVNLIGHSHGGPTARYVAGVAPQLVASVSSVGSPHFGSDTADLLTLLPEGGTLQGLAATVADGLGTLIDALSDGDLPQDSLASLESLSTEGSAAFNAAFPAGKPTRFCGEGPQKVNGVQYFSWGGTGVLTNALDLSDAALGVTSLSFGFEQNDGVVGQCSNHWGRVIRDDFFLNHIDEINHLLGLHSAFVTDPITLYRQQANRLRNLGL